MNLQACKIEQYPFRYQMVATGLLDREGGWAFAVAVFLQILAGMAVMSSVAGRTPPSTQPPPHITLIAADVPPLQEKPEPPTRIAEPRLGLDVRPPIDRLPASANKIRGSITFRWELDPHQYLPLVLERHGGALGFGPPGERVTHKFLVPGWRPEPLRPEGVNLGPYFALAVVPALGSYRFVEEIRSSDTQLRGLSAYALLDKRLQMDLEDEVRAVAQKKCAADDALDATLRLDPIIDFRIVSVRCVKKDESAK